MTSPIKNLLLALTSILLSIAVGLILAEVFLRFLPVNEGLRAQPVNEQNPVFRFEPNRDATYSSQWNFAIVNDVHVNNAGFVSDHDYNANDSRPLLAVIGDSYIEAIMVPYAETLQGRLAKKLGTSGRIYSFAASGAGLPQYLVWAKFAAETYKPDAFLFNIISNDFAESLQEFEHSPGFHRFTRGAQGSAEFIRTDYEPSLIRRLLRKSALAMYLFTNIKVQNIANFQLNLGKNDNRWVANVKATDSKENLEKYRWAIDRFLDLVPAHVSLPPSKVILSFDGFRPHMYQGEKELQFALNSTWSQMRRYFMAQARTRGYVVVDGHQAFMADYTRNGKRFEFPTDSHWNGNGHRVIAEEIEKNELFKATFGR